MKNEAVFVADYDLFTQPSPGTLVDGIELMAALFHPGIFTFNNPGVNTIQLPGNSLTMCKHEEKYCPRCKASFECKVGDIAQCQCNGLALTVEERAFIADRYDDCLCRNCLLELRQRAVLIFITGGARSGKSRYAQELALQLSANPLYIATARQWDEEFSERVRRHRLEKG